MSKSRALVCLAVVTLGFSIFSQAVVADRITAPLSGGPMVAIPGNVHPMVKPENDLGRADTSRLIQGISLAFRPSAAQQQDLDNFLKQLADPTSPNYHKYLTPKQFGARFGMSPNDLDKVETWLQSEGFANFKISNSRNYISFDGTVGQIESVFKLEMHNYLVNGVVHLANAQPPSVPAALSGIVISVGHLQDFAPRPRAVVKSNFTSYVSGNHFLTPGDFATIYDITPLYNAGITGAGQKIAIVGQSTVSATDLSNFRSRAGLPASTVTMTLQGGTATRCSGDEGESDLDLEWAGGVAKGAQIIFVYAGLGTGDTCTGTGGRTNSVWEALQYAIDNKVAPFISTSYGYCESGLQTNGFLTTLQTWAQQAVSQGQTITSASGDAGAADCESGTSTTATTGYAVDGPASVPEVTGAGGNEFTGDTAGTVTGNQAAGDPPYWGASGAGSDGISTALEYIPEMAWNDTQTNGTLSASGGGASIQFAKPSWQNVTGVPNDSWRHVPDLSVSASADHDGYLVCSEDGPNNTIVQTCVSGFRESAGGNLDVVGGTSAAAPTISAIFALINQYLGNVPPTGLAPINPTLYSLYANNSSTNAFHDVTTGNNIVPCTQGTTSCPSSKPFQFGFSAGVGYDQVTGLGSIDANKFAQAWAATRAATSITVTPSTPTSWVGASVTFTATVTPSTTTGVVNFYNNGSSSALGQATLSASGVAAFATSALPVGTNNVTATFAGNTTSGNSTTATAAVVAVSVPFTLSSNPSSVSVVAGHNTTSTITVTPQNGFAQPLTFSCANVTGVTCTFAPNTTTQTTVALSIATAPSMAAASTPVTITATTGGSNAATNTTQVTMAVSKTDQSFTLSPSATTYQVVQGANATAIITLAPTKGFNANVTYTCSDTASESTCTGPPGPVSSSTPASFLITTTAPTAQLHRPMDHNRGIFFAMLFPAFLGIMFTMGPVRRRSVRLLALVMALGFSTLWIASCGGSSGSGTKNPGTPVGSYTITVNATTGGASPVTGQTTFTLNVQ
ncbi:MAG TPA: protease pro-enzyme activation domain-containing protein [Candidatus Sulfotelmatobacter sp.]|nr:protease pro-enzyme activation domain-containing protein [Candidatus Sulfotelmatobacter sp.]